MRRGSGRVAMDPVLGSGPSRAVKLQVALHEENVHLLAQDSREGGRLAPEQNDVVGRGYASVLLGTDIRLVKKSVGKSTAIAILEWETVVTSNVGLGEDVGVTSAAVDRIDRREGPERVDKPASAVGIDEDGQHLRTEWNVFLSGEELTVGAFELADLLYHRDRITSQHRHCAYHKKRSRPSIEVK